MRQIWEQMLAVIHFFLKQISLLNIDAHDFSSLITRTHLSDNNLFTST